MNMHSGKSASKGEVCWLKTHCGNACLPGRGHRVGLCLRRPLAIEAHAVIERLLRAHAGGRQAGIEIGTLHRFKFRNTLGEKYGEATDECVSGTRAVDGLNGKGGNVLATYCARHE